MRLEKPAMEEVSANFERALEEAQRGKLPTTDMGFSGRVYQAITDVAKAPDGKQAGRVTAARRVYADHLAGNDLLEDARKLLAESG